MKPALSIPDDGYRRTFAAETDVHSASELIVHGVMRDHRFALKHRWKLRTPDYEVIEAAAQQSDGGTGQLSQDLCRRYPAISGVRIGRGFSGRVRAALGDLPGTQEHLFLAIEMARAGQQVYQFPPELARQFAASSETNVAHTAWQKDRAYMIDLRNSCHTYRDESDELFRTREVRCGFDPALTNPQPGSRRVFWRNKRLSICPGSAPGSFHCESAMEDSVHDIAVSFSLSAEGVISEACSRGLRLPYHGICEDPHERTPGLNGLRVTNEYVRQLADQVGGRSGCTHIFDLSLDVLRLFSFDE